MLLFLAFACTGSSPTTAPTAGPTPSAELLPKDAPAAQPTVDLTGATPRTWRALDALGSATITLPPPAAGDKPTGDFPIAATWGEGGSLGKLRVWTHPLPFACDMPRPNYAPFGARLLVGDREVPYLATAEDASGIHESWYIDRDQIKLLTSEDPRTWTGTHMVAADLQAGYARRDPTASGLSAAQFVQTTWTHEGLTRSALYLPAPATVAFDVPVPDKAHLRFTPGLLPDPVAGAPKGDGADLVVRVDGEEAWKGGVDAGGTAPAVDVDLTKWAGKTVKLELGSTPRGGRDGDDVVLANPELGGARTHAPRRIVVVGIDTLRRDALSINGASRSTPELDAWAKQSVRFDDAYAPAPRTRPSFRTAMTGMYPLDAIHAKTVAEYLAPQGYATAGFTANIHLVPRFGFADGFQTWHYENGARAEVEVDRAVAWLKDHADEDAFVFVHLMDPHTFYDAPEPFSGMYAKNRPSEVPSKFNRWQIYQLMNQRLLTPPGREWIRAAYDEEVAYTAHQLARLLGEVDQLPGQTLEVVHSDHGEEFWDHGGYEHNHTLYDELVRTVLWIRPPGGWGGGDHVVKDQVGLVDLVPTILDFAGVPEAEWPKGPGRSLRPFVDASRASDAAGLSAALDARPLVLGHLMFDQERWGVVYQHWKYMLMTQAGREFLYDLSADPKEQNNLRDDAHAEQLATMRKALGDGTGWPMRPGYRVRIPPDDFPIHFTFDQPVDSVGIVDPEALRKVRTNLEWGEVPPQTVQDVGTFTLGADKRSADFTPGRDPSKATLWIACAAEPCVTGSFTRDGDSSAFGPAGAESRKPRVQFELGWLLLPKETEAEVLATPDPSAIAELQALGYVAGESGGD